MLKEKLQAHLMAQFLSKMPELEPFVDYVELSTPLSSDHFVRPVQGSIYGLEPTPERFATEALRPGSRVPNLFFSGSEVTGVGVVGAMMGGVMAATAVDARGAVKMLRGL